MEIWLKKETIFRGNIIEVDVGEARLLDGTMAPREVVRHGGGVGIVPVWEDQVLLVRQFRIAVGHEVLEIPAGRLEPNESPEERALIELEEEIGYRAGRLVHVASCYCSPGFTNEKDHLYLAFNLEKTAQRPEFDERIDIAPFPLDDVEAGLRDGFFDDGKTIIGLQALLAYKRRNGDAE